MSSGREIEVSELKTRAEALRAAIARAQTELESVSAEERAISDRIAELAAPPKPNPNPKPEVPRIKGGWTRAPFAKKTTTFEREPSPVMVPAAAPSSKTATTVLMTAPQLRLRRREAWRVALAGAGLSAVLATIGFFVYQEARPTAHAPPTVVAAPEPPPPPKKIITAEPPPTALPLPTVVPTTTVAPPVRPAPTGFFGLRRHTETPPRVPSTSTSTPADDADRLLNGALGDPTTPAPSMGAITIVCMPKCDQTIDNGVALGPGHIFNRPVTAGRHVLVLSAPNGVKKTLTVNITANVTRDVRVMMEAPQPPPPTPAPSASSLSDVF